MNVFAGNRRQGRLARSFYKAGKTWWPACAFAWLLVLATAHAATFQDLFANRQILTNASGQLTGDNSSATVEPSEPLIAGKVGGHSVWISWVAPANGIATFRTDGSSFDTLLASYYFGSTNDTTLDKLHLAAGNDDTPGLASASLIQFGALAGQHYEISVDGYYGAVGSVTLKWSFVNATSPPPIILRIPNDQAARQGDPVSLTVNMTTSPGMQLQWRLDETEIQEFGTNLFIPSLQPTNIGHYSLRVTLGSVRFFTSPVELQINSEGQTNVLVQDKLLDAPGSELRGSDGSGSSLAKPRPLGGRVGPTPLIGVVRGYTGSQIFDTTYATTDPSEPSHCGFTGGSSYWLMYQPPTNGTMTLDTIGSTYDTVMEAYIFNGTLTSYTNLISITCDHGSVPGASRIQFPLLVTRQYLVVVDGVNGASGVAELNYNLNTNQPPIPPTLQQPPSALVVTNGWSGSIVAPLQGCPPMYLSWSKDGHLLQGRNSASLPLSNVTSNDSGSYTLTVTNDLGTLNATYPLHVVVPPTCALAVMNKALSLSWPTVAGQLYTVEEAGALPGPWKPWTNSYLGDGAPVILALPNASGAEFYRVRVQ
jgi:hypothetical protein